jgi:D-lactate dehydrogenase (cytochrome)
MPRFAGLADMRHSRASFHCVASGVHCADGPATWTETLTVTETNDQRLSTEGFLEDAAHYPGGHAVGVVFPRTAEEVADIVTHSPAILPIGAQSSVTGGATPMGELIVATSKMNRVVELTSSHVTVEAGITIAEIQEHLARAGAWFPPSPTFTGACAGGIVSTNAAGAATFKYGSTRDWVEALTVVLADGSILEIRRGDHRARDGRFEIDTRSGRITVPLPIYVMPPVAKRSAGYHAQPGMDLIDLFIGSEGTLGIVTRVTFRIVSPAPDTALALVPCGSEAQAIDAVLALRAASYETWRTADPAGIDAAAIEDMDRRSIQIVHEDGADTHNNVTFPRGTAVALLVRLELPAGTDAAAAYAQIGGALGDETRDTPLVRFCQLLDKLRLLDTTELAMPGDHRRMEQLIAIREAVPSGVNARVGAAKRDIDPRIEKTAADMVVPVERFADMMAAYRRGFESRGIDYAVWGHISDGNVHPNVIPRSFDDVVRGKEAILEFGREVVRLGGCPLAEHGVGRNPVKQALLRQLYGDEGIEEMRSVKRALDPQWKLSPGVIFARSS